MNTFSSLRNTDYRYLWIGNFFNMAGFWIQMVTVGWLVWELSGSATLVGITGGLCSVPFIVMGPLGGVLADRLDRRRLLMTTQTIMAVIALLFAMLVALHWVRVWHAMVFSFLMGCGFNLNMPVRQSLVANTVPRNDLGNAIALNAMAMNATRVVGPAVGGILIVAFGAAGNFLLQAALYLCMVAIIFPMRVPYRDTASASDASALRNLQEGVQYVWGNKTLFGLVMLSFIPALFVMPDLPDIACLYRSRAPCPGQRVRLPDVGARSWRSPGCVHHGLIRGTHSRRVVGHRRAVVCDFLRHPLLAIQPALDGIRLTADDRLLHDDLSDQQ